MMLINSPQLLQTNISDHQITQTVRECVSLSDPGPHVIVLLLKHEQCSAEDQECVEKVLLSFSERVYQHTMVLTTQETRETSDILQKITQKCANRHFSLQRSSSPDDLLQTFEEIVQMNDGQHLDCEGSQNLIVEQQTTERLSEGVKLNLVVCGSDATLKSSISEQILQQTDRRSDVEIHGRLISLVELPALNQLSEEEVIRETLNCVSFCDPGVHVFLLIVSDALLTDEDKAEIEEIQKIFDSREHFIVLFTTDFTVEGSATDLVKSNTESQRLISRCGGQCRLMGLNEPENSRQIPDLLDYIENMKTEPYSLQMYVKAQENRVRRETEEKYEEDLKRMENEIKELKQKIQSEGAEGEADDQKCLRIVLIGRTGNGKSATGNTILGRNEFESKASTDSVTTVCQKRVGEVAGRSVAVVDTPGLFDTTLTNDQVTEEIMKCVSLSTPGPHVFVIVLSLLRLTKEETDTVDLIKKIFGHKAAQFSIVLFTRGDELENESLQDYVKRSKSAELKKLIRDCGNRFLVFNNREKQDKTQVIQLLNMIEELKNTNEGRYFTNSMFEEAEMSIKKRMEQILKEKEREIQTEIHEMEMKIMRKTLEEEKERSEMKMKNQLRKVGGKGFFEEKEKTEKEKREIENQKQSEEENQQRAGYHQKNEEMKSKIENQRSQYEKQQKERAEDRKREEKYRKDQEKMNMNKRTKDEHERECIIAEKKQRNKEEKERQRWKKNKQKKIKEAENDRKEVQEEIKHQSEKDEKMRQMRKKEEEEKRRKERHKEELREKQEVEIMRKKFENERKEEQQKIEEERQKLREGEEKNRVEIKKHNELMEQERKEEWERRKLEDDERREERKIWKEIIEDLRQEREESKRREIQRKEREEKERDEMKQKHEEEIKDMKRKHEDEARKQAEELNYFRERNKRQEEQLKKMTEEHVREITWMFKDLEEVEEEKDEEIKELEQEVKILRNKIKL